MSHRFPVLLKSGRVLAAAIATGWLATVPLSLPLAAQARTAAKPAAAKSKIPRTPDGHPDLQGVWRDNNITPLERPKALATQSLLTDEQVAALKRRAAQLFSGDGDAAFGDSVEQLVPRGISGGQVRRRSDRWGHQQACNDEYRPS